MNYNKGQLGQIAKQYGFVRDTFEKVLRLKEILTYLNTNEYLHEHLALKGGTAINMTIFNLPRLSVDLDLDYSKSAIERYGKSQKENYKNAGKLYDRGRIFSFRIFQV